jgi:hypothetical protein
VSVSICSPFVLWYINQCDDAHNEKLSYKLHWICSLFYFKFAVEKRLNQGVHKYFKSLTSKKCNDNFIRLAKNVSLALRFIYEKMKIKYEHGMKSFHSSAWKGCNLKLTAFCNIVPCSLEVDLCFRCATKLPWWRQYAPLKCQSTSLALHGAVSQKAVIFILAAVGTWSLLRK